MSNLIDDVPEAVEFLEDVRGNVERYYLYPEERFAEIHDGVFQTSSVDLDGERFAPENLKTTAEFANAGLLWVTLEHDPQRPPLGRVLAAKRFYSRHHKMWFVAGVSGVFAESVYSIFEDVGLATNVTNADPRQSPTEELRAHLGMNHHETDVGPFESLLTSAPPEVSPTIAYDVRKGAAPWDQITLYASIALVAFNPFSKAYLTRLGEKAADASVALGKWVTDRLAPTIADRLRQETLFSLKSKYRDCEVQFLIAANDVATITAAWASREDGIRSALHLVDGLQERAPQRVVYRYDHRETNSWLPLYVVTKMGIIRDRRCLIPFADFKGLSIGGSSGEVASGRGSTWREGTQSAPADESDEPKP